MDNGDNDTLVMPPFAAAQRLGIADSTLRRLAPTYERVYGPLPWETGKTGKKEGGGRMWPESAVRRVEEARAFVTAGHAKSLESALEAIREGAHLPDAPLARPVMNAEMQAWEREQIADIMREVMRPIIREELAVLTPAERPSEEPEPQRRPGVGERAGRWFDDLLRRFRGG